MKRLLTLLFFAAGTMLAGPRIFFGFSYGPPAPVMAYYPPPAPVVSYYAPPVVRPGYTWIGGYYYPAGRRWAWRPGYWARPPYAHAYWVAPRYYGHRYYAGYWRR